MPFSIARGCTCNDWWHGGAIKDICHELVLPRHGLVAKEVIATQFYSLLEIILPHKVVHCRKLFLLQ